MVQGPGPGPRYGHVMALVGQRYLMAIGGNDGQSMKLSPFFKKIYLITLETDNICACCQANDL